MLYVIWNYGKLFKILSNFLEILLFVLGRFKSKTKKATLTKNFLKNEQTNC